MALGAVARRGSQYGRRSRSRHFNVHVEVNRNVGAASGNQYVANACLLRSTHNRRAGRGGARCGYGVGRTPTAAAKKALRAMASKLK